MPENRYYIFKYERINNKAANSINAAIEPHNMSIAYADTQMMVLVVQNNTPGNESAKLVREEIWKHNGGAYCDFVQVQEESVIDYI